MSKTPTEPLREEVPPPRAVGRGPSEVFGYLLALVSVCLAMFLAVRVQRSPRHSPAVDRRPAAPQAARDRKPSAVDAIRYDQPRKLSAKGTLEVPSPLEERSFEAVAVHEAPAPRTTAAKVEDWRSYGGGGDPGGAGGFMAHSAAPQAAQSGPAPAARRRGETSAPQAERRRGEGGRSAYAGTGGTASRYGAAAGPARPKPARHSAQRPPEKAAEKNAKRAEEKSVKEVLKQAQSIEVAALGGGASGAAAGAQITDPVFQGVFEQLDADQKAVEHLQERVEERAAAGQPVDRESMLEEAQSYIADNGIDADSVDPGALVERSLSPKPPEDPVALGAHVRKVMKDFKPPAPEERQEILILVENPPEKHEPPPQDALQTYEFSRGAFRQAEEELGVKAHHILGILGVETRFGNYTGKHPLLQTLHTIAGKGGSRGKQAQRDIAALMRLDKSGELGGRDIQTIGASYAGAMGIPQFLPSSWEAYALDQDGGGRDPFSYPDAVVSVANYLKKHGYRESVKKSFWGYNHSDEYVNKVYSLSERIKPALPKP